MTPDQKKLIVIGASRGIGLETVKQGLKAGHLVRAFARSASGIAIPDDQYLERYDGDALNQTDVETGIANCDAVILTLGVPANLKMLTGPITLFSKATRTLLRAMKSQGVNRVICVTGFGAGDSYDSINSLQRLGFNAVFGRAYADKTIQESLIRSSDLTWTIVRPGVLCNFDKLGGI